MKVRDSKSSWELRSESFSQLSCPGQTRTRLTWEWMWVDWILSRAWRKLSSKFEPVQSRLELQLPSSFDQSLRRFVNTHVTWKLVELISAPFYIIAHEQEKKCFRVLYIRVRSLQDQKNSKTFKDLFCLFSKTLKAISCRKIASVSTIFTQ
jgi:hypothetical protein